MLPLTRLRKRTRFFGVSGPSFALNFVNGGALDPRITFTRASSATYFDDAGTLQSAAINAPRLDYDPATLAARGLLIEEQRTNSIRNNTMQGAVAGTPGTLPTNWGVNISGGYAINVIGTGTENGVAYIDLQFVGTTTTTSSTFRFETNNQIVAASGQTWAGSFYVKSVAGSTANISAIRVNIQGRNSAFGSNTDSNSSADFLSTIGIINLAAARRTHAFTFADATTAYAQLNLLLAHTSGAAIDITLRIGLPQLELGAFATSVIPTTTTALTRSADVASVNTLSPWFNQPEGGLYVEWQSNPTAYARYLVSIEQAASSATRIDININAANTVNPRTVVSGAAVATLSGGTYTAGTIAKVAFGYKSTDYASSLNGAAVVTAATAGALPSSLATMYLGSITGGTQANGWLRRLTFYPRRPSNAELVALST